MHITTKRFLLMAAFAFGSVISFFQINSYWADKHNFNGGWLIIGIVLGLVAMYWLRLLVRDSSGGAS